MSQLKNIAFKNLVLLSYGSISESLRAIFCILSFNAWRRSNDRTRIIVYTDKPDFFKSYLRDLDIEYVLLNAKDLTDMQAGINFNHRIKVSVIDLTYKKYPEQSLIFVDSDTFFTGIPTPLLQNSGPEISYMHKKEYNFNEGLELFRSYGEGEFPEAFLNYIAGRDFEICGEKMRFNNSDYCWNSGLVGLNCAFKKYMPDVLKLTEEFYLNSKWFVSEQLAFSLILQRTTTIKRADSFVFHYWAPKQKKFADELILNFFSEFDKTSHNGKFALRILTIEWKCRIEADQLYTASSIAFSERFYKYGFRKRMHSLLKAAIASQFRILGEFVSS